MGQAASVEPVLSPAIIQFNIAFYTIGTNRYVFFRQ